MPSDIYIKLSTGWSSAAKNIFIKTASATWSAAKSVFLFFDAGWTKVWPLSGVYATSNPFISTTSSSTELSSSTVLRVGTTYRGNRGTWNPNGYTISSYQYKWVGYTYQDTGDLTTNYNPSMTTLSGTTNDFTITGTSGANYDKSWITFFITAKASGGTVYDGSAESFRYYVVRQKPKLSSGGTPTFNITSPKVGDILTYSSSWDITDAYKPDAARSTIVWYKNSSNSTTSGTIVQNNGSYSYTVQSSDLNNYIYAIETVFNSGSDYELGPTVGVEGSVITNSAVIGSISAPTSLTASSNRGDGVYLTWNAVSGANYYEIYWQSVQGSGPVNQSTYADYGTDNSITTNSFLDTGITPGTTRYYRVRARSASVSNGANCSNWYPAPASNAVSGSRVKPGPITSCTAYAFSANTINGYFTTGSNTDSVQYRLRGITIPVSTPLYSLSTISSYPYEVSLSVSGSFTERTWNSDTYSPSTTYKLNNTVWYAGNQYQVIRQVLRQTAPYDEIGFSGVAPTNNSYWSLISIVTYSPGDYVIYNGTRYYVTQTTNGTYPNNGSYWQNGLGQWRLEVTPYFSTGAGDVVYSTSTRDVLLSHLAAGDPLTLSSGPTFTSIGTNSFTTNYTTGINANYVHIDTYRTEDITRPTGYPKIESKSTSTAYTDTPTGSVIIPSKNYTVTIKPRYYYSLSPAIFYDGTPSTNYVDTLSLNYQQTGTQKRVFLPSVFNSGTSIYVSTNGYINWGGNDPGGAIAIPSSGITIAPLTGDLRQGAASASANTSTGGLWYYSDANNYYVTWWGNYYSDAAQVARYQVKFYWGQAYADIYIVNNSLTTITPSTTAVQNNANEYQNWSTVSNQASTLLSTASMNRVSTQDGVDDNRTAIVASAPALNWTVTWDAAGGTGGGTTTQNRGLAHTAPSPGTRDGFDFVYYRYPASGGTDPVFVSSGGSYTPTADVTFGAIWSTKTYTVSYDANGGVGAPASQTKTHGVTLTLSSTTPTRATVGTTAYTFNGWNTASNGTGTNYSAGGSYTLNAPLALFAKWTTSTVVSIPTNVTQPTLSGGLAVGTTFTFGVGTWTGSPTSYNLRLYRGTPGVITSETLVKSAGNVTSSTYVIPQSDYDDPSNRRYYRAFASATNSAGTSNSGTLTPGVELGPITSAPVTPATAPGVVSGTPTNGWTGGTTYPVSWTAATPGTVSGGAAATISSYQIRVYEATSNTGTGSYLYDTITSLGSGTSYTYTSPNSVKYYAFSISATNSAGLSSASYSSLSLYK